MGSSALLPSALPVPSYRSYVLAPCPVMGWVDSGCPCGPWPSALGSQPMFPSRALCSVNGISVSQPGSETSRAGLATHMLSCPLLTPDLPDLHHSPSSLVGPQLHIRYLGICVCSLVCPVPVAFFSGSASGHLGMFLTPNTHSG